MMMSSTIPSAKRHIGLLAERASEIEGPRCASVLGLSHYRQNNANFSSFGIGSYRDDRRARVSELIAQTIENLEI